jgi:hypothetical protein
MSHYDQDARLNGLEGNTMTCRLDDAHGLGLPFGICISYCYLIIPIYPKHNDS